MITDPVHGDIHLNKLEVAIVDSRPFQRLRRIRQLGNTHLVYPGAVHTRFSHCLGALSVVQELLDIVWKQSAELHGVKEDLFAEWVAREREGNASAAEEEWANATMLARLGALLHDICHVPAGHTVEDDLGILEPHDENDGRFEWLWRQLSEDVPGRLAQLGVGEKDCKRVEQEMLDPESELYRELRPLIVSKGDDVPSPSKMKYPFCADLVGNTICADLLDYLARDHLFTGLPESLGSRFVSAFFVAPSERGSFSERLVLNILRNDHERTDVVSELLKALRYRYELSERALVHPAKLAADAMLGESIERWEWALWWSAAKKRELVEETIPKPGHAIDRVPAERARLELAARKKDMSKREWAKTDLGKVEKEIREAMEAEFRCLGDEGLLDFLADLPNRPDDLSKPLRRASGKLASDLRDRRLFRIAERVGAGDISPRDVFADYGAPADRARLEAEAQYFADLGPEPKVVLWLPPPDMRLKLAEVLVQQKAGIAPFVTYERSRSRRGSDIYDAHGRLWAAYVFVRRDLSELEEQMVSAFLGWRMGIRWERHRYLGEHPDQWPLRLAVAQEFDADFDSKVDAVLEEYEGELGKVAAKMPKTFRALQQRVHRARTNETPD